MILTKARQAEAIEHLCFSQHLRLISSGGLQGHAFAKFKIVSGQATDTTNNINFDECQQKKIKYR